MNKVDQERGKTTTEKNHRYCFSVTSGRCFVYPQAFMLFFICLRASWYTSGTGASRGSTTHRSSLSPEVRKRDQNTFSSWSDRSRTHHSHPSEHPVSFHPLFQFITVDNPDCEPTPPCDERPCTGGFRLPDMDPFVLSSSDTRSLFCFACWARRTNILRVVPGLSSLERLTIYLNNFIYL